MDVYFIDGEFVPADKAFVPVNDLAVLRGYGVFDFLRTYAGKPFYLKAHIQRLERSASAIGMHMPWRSDQIYDVVMQTLERNNHAESNIRIVVTGGLSNDFITPLEKPRLLVMVTKLHEMPARWYADGVKIITIAMDRYIPAAKSINYIPAIMALAEARQKNAVEAIYRDRNQRVLEGTTANIFAVFGDALITPEKDILPGVTRQVVLKLASDMCAVETRDLALAELIEADEVFITSSNKEILPVVKVDQRVVGDQKPGRLTGRIMQRFSDYSKQYGLGREVEL